VLTILHRKNNADVRFTAGGIAGRKRRTKKKEKTEPQQFELSTSTL